MKNYFFTDKRNRIHNISVDKIIRTTIDKTLSEITIYFNNDFLVISLSKSPNPKGENITVEKQTFNDIVNYFSLPQH